MAEAHDDKSRQDFERYAAEQGSSDFERNEFDGYRNPFTSLRWGYWKAAQASLSHVAPLEQAALICDQHAAMQVYNPDEKRVAMSCAERIRKLAGAPSVPSTTACSTVSLVADIQCAIAALNNSAPGMRREELALLLQRTSDAITTPSAIAPKLPKATGVTRDKHNGITVFFERELTDNEMRALHDWINGRYPATFDVLIDSEAPRGQRTVLRSSDGGKQT